ncbi:PREDICTED: protein C8orf37 homolog isoform X1 [Rhinopithecus bieti]|uniref:protein C8orf37 homolog isoform X1 n=1 Tax=Rhinopithecus bieti TaxID=61621 RepID=UPI00083C628A|nr:PREDICTED: protein C8orf37 homolog isoform X1 [Rhinopithecus bieti]
MMTICGTNHVIICFSAAPVPVAHAHPPAPQTSLPVPPSPAPGLCPSSHPQMLPCSLCCPRPLPDNHRSCHHFVPKEWGFRTRRVGEKTTSNESGTGGRDSRIGLCNKIITQREPQSASHFQGKVTPAVMGRPRGRRKQSPSKELRASLSLELGEQGLGSDGVIESRGSDTELCEASTVLLTCQSQWLTENCGKASQLKVRPVWDLDPSSAGNHLTGTSALLLSIHLHVFLFSPEYL